MVDMEGTSEVEKKRERRKEEGKGRVKRGGWGKRREEERGEKTRSKLGFKRKRIRKGGRKWEKRGEKRKLRGSKC